MYAMVSPLNCPFTPDEMGFPAISQRHSLSIFKKLSLWRKLLEQTLFVERPNSE